MRKKNDSWILSPRDLIAELECNHRLNLEWSAITGLIQKPTEENDPGLQLIIDNGRAHENNLLKKHQKEGRVISIEEPGTSLEKIRAAAEKTIQSSKEEYDVIHQAVLFTGDFLGYGTNNPGRNGYVGEVCGSVQN